MRAARTVQLAAVAGLCAGLAPACLGRTSGAGPQPASGPSAPPVVPEVSGALPERAVTLDLLTFGDPRSEAAHGLSTRFSEVQAVVDPVPLPTSAGPASDAVTGQLGLPARRLLPRTPNPDYYGGEVSFRMAVDPAKLNHLTVKTWGADTSRSWMVLVVEGYEVGWRHDYLATDERLFHDVNGWFQGGFVYRTERLPFHLTRGKTSVTVTLRSLGEIHFYAGGGYDARQTRMSQATVPLHAAYTHTGGQLDVTAERQGPGAAGTPRADDADAVAARWRQVLDDLVKAKLAAAPASLTPDDLHFLAQAHGTSWTTGYRDAAVVAQVRDGLDALVTAYAAAPATYVGSHGNDSWGGYLGGAGAAVRLLWDPLSAGTDLDVDVDYAGSLGTTTRRDAWGTALRASVDWGRFHRTSITAQMLYAAWRTYLGNSGLLLLDPAKALAESEARRYLYEAAGIWPWKGDDLPGGGDTPVQGPAPYGPAWYAFTTDGTAKDPCLDGGDYGEVGGEVLRWALDTGDALLREQALHLLRARVALRHPWVDAKGVRALIAVEPIGCRNEYEIGWHVAYLSRASADVLRAGALGPDVAGADLVGYLQQAKAEGQLLPVPGGGAAGYFDLLALPEAYDRFKVLAPTGKRLPMSDGEPDFAWADRENMAVAARHGDERFWAVLDWGCAASMNRLARVFATTPTHAFIAEVGLDDVQYTPAGRLRLVGGAVEGDGGLSPPDHPVNANVGQLQPVALRADLAAEPATNRDAGRADAYTLRYGHWLVGLNAHPTRPYTVRTPPGFTSAVDLASGRSWSGPVTIAPRSYVVFWLEDAVGDAAGPANPLRLTALPASGGVMLGWDPTPGAASYRILRASPGDVAYEVVAAGVTGTTFLDASAPASGTASYRVQAVGGGGGAGGPSPAASAPPLATGLGVDWASADGIAWTKVSSVDVALPELVHVGLAATAHTTDGRLSLVEFSDVAAPAPP